MKSTTGYLKKQASLFAAGVLLLHNSLVLAAPTQLTLEESIKLALSNNPAVQISAADKEKSLWGVNDAKSGRYPTVSLSSGYSANDRSADLLSEDLNNSLRLNWQIYNGGRVENQIEQAKLGLVSADLGMEKTKQQLKLDTATGYYSILQAGNMVAVGRETVDNFKEHRKVVQAKYEAGVVAKSDMLRSEVELANAEQNLIKYENQYDLAVFNLITLMNINADIGLELVDELQYVASDRTLEESLQLARTNRPDIAQANAAARSASYGVAQAESGKLPSVAFSASTGWDNKLLPNGDNWSVGLSASWNVFDASSTKAKIKQAESSREKAVLQVEQVTDSAEQEVRQSYLGMKEAEKRLAAVSTAVAKANEDLYIANEKYKAGVGTNLDVIDAQLALTQAKTNHIQALYDYNVNRARLDKAVGTQVN